MDGRQKRNEMTTQQPDHFFRDKLAEHQRPAPRAAWDRIEASLEKPKKKFLLWNVAASLTLLSAIGYTLWTYNDSANIQAVSEHVETNRTSASEEKNQHEAVEVGKDKIEGEAKSTQPTLASTSQKSKRSTKKSKSAKVASSVATENTFVQTENLQSVEQVLNGAENKNPEPAIAPVKKSSSITITLTAEETDKYLDKSALAEATSKEQKSSTFKKFLKKANDLKSNQDPFGDLREKKNEILALNFKNEKRGQNK